MEIFKYDPFHLFMHFNGVKFIVGQDIIIRLCPLRSLCKFVMGKIPKVSVIWLKQSLRSIVLSFNACRLTPLITLLTLPCETSLTTVVMSEIERYKSTVRIRISSINLTTVFL